MNRDRLQRLADDVIAIGTDTPEKAQTLAETLRQSGNWPEIVAGMDSVAICYDPLTHEVAHVEAALVKALANDDILGWDATAITTIPIRYGGVDGPDMASVCAALEMSERDFIAKHTAQVFPVDMIGFTPGFAYLGGFEQASTIARLAKPRLHVPAGSIGICAGQTGLYALPGPGGWPLIGRAQMPLFNPNKDDPFLIKPGMQVRLTSVGQS